MKTGEGGIDVRERLEERNKEERKQVMAWDDAHPLSWF